MSQGGVGELDQEQLERLASYFDEEVTFSRHIKIKVEDVEPGRAVLYLDVEDIHFNGSGSLHGGVYTSLIDNATGLSVSSLVGLRTATIQMDAHFLEPVSGGRITCRGEVVHRTRRMATAEGRVYDGEGNLVAMGAGVFRIFEKEGSPVV
ncbi:MAG TPA: PaaI family thioesterase [Rubrobacteraceae bacterium]|nr:PaaI family thioesterase [Rubrobacteraceae bacterium]